MWQWHISIESSDIKDSQRRQAILLAPSGNLGGVAEWMSGWGFAWIFMCSSRYLSRAVCVFVPVIDASRVCWGGQSVFILAHNRIGQNVDRQPTGKHTNNRLRCAALNNALSRVMLPPFYFSRAMAKSLHSWSWGLEPVECQSGLSVGSAAKLHALIFIQ